MPSIHRKFPGKKAADIYQRVDAVMVRIADELRLDYRTDGASHTGQVAKMGISGVYAVRDGEVTVELKYPMLVPGTLKKKVEERIGEKLDGLFA